MTCIFCSPPENSILVYEDLFCYAILENEQSIKGYTLVINKPHRDTLFSDALTDSEMVGFWRGVQKVGNAIKDAFGAERIYVISMCDGVTHFHVHLAPRYAWTDKDKIRYRELFTERDGKESVDKCVRANTIGGFWYLADTEKDYHKTDFMSLPEGRRLSILKLRALEISQRIKE